MLEDDVNDKLPTETGQLQAQIGFALDAQAPSIEDLFARGSAVELFEVESQPIFCVSRFMKP
jgi:hypothetical protein